MVKKIQVIFPKLSIRKLNVGNLKALQHPGQLILFAE